MQYYKIAVKTKKINIVRTVHKHNPTKSSELTVFQKNFGEGSLRDTPKDILKKSIPFFAGMIATIIYFIYDIVYDLLYEDPIGTLHFTLEVFAFIGVSMALIAGVRYLVKVRVRLYGEEQRNYLLAQDLVEILNLQMSEWEMTPSEKEIAWLIIKGYRFSEIAELRGVKESTTRLQATSLYAKAGVKSRSEFVAEIFQTVLMFTGVDATKTAQT